MGSKAFMLIVLAIFLVITSKVAARELAQSSTISQDNGQANELNDAKFLDVVFPRQGGAGLGGTSLPGGLPGIGGGIGGFPGEGFGGGRGGGYGGSRGYYGGYPRGAYGGYYPGGGYGGGYPRGGWYGGWPRN